MKKNLLIIFKIIMFKYILFTKIKITFNNLIKKKYIFQIIQ